MKRLGLVIFLVGLVSFPVLAQDQHGGDPDNTSITDQVVPPQGSYVVVKRDTPVELMAYSEISTADVTAGKRFRLLLNQPISVDGKVIAPVGTPAWGEVTSARDSGGLGKSGRMTAKLLFLQLGDVEIPLDGETNAKGTGAGSTGVAILFTGWAGFFHRGNNAKIKAGEIVTGFVAEDVALDMTVSPARRVALGAQDQAVQP